MVSAPPACHPSKALHGDLTPKWLRGRWNKIILSLENKVRINFQLWESSRKPPYTSHVLPSVPYGSRSQASPIWPWERSQTMASCKGPSLHRTSRSTAAFRPRYSVLIYRFPNSWKTRGSRIQRVLAYQGAKLVCTCRRSSQTRVVISLGIRLPFNYPCP